MKTIDDYVDQIQEDSDRWFDYQGNELAVMALGLVGESGEVCDIVKKIMRGSITLDEAMDHLQEEIIDVFHYWCMLVGHLSIDVETVYRHKREFNVGRFG